MRVLRKRLFRLKMRATSKRIKQYRRLIVKASFRQSARYAMNCFVLSISISPFLKTQPKQPLYGNVNALRQTRIDYIPTLFTRENPFAT